MSELPDYAAIPDAGDVAQTPGSFKSAPQDPGFLQRTANSAWLNGSIQLIERGIEMLNPTEEGFKPLNDPRLVGKEHLMPWAREARSSAELGAMLTRWDEAEKAREIDSLHGTIWNNLAGAILDPVNLAIPGISMGRSVLVGAARAGAYEGAVSVPGLIASASVDPTYDAKHIAEDVFWNVVGGAVLGGAFGAGSRVAETALGSTSRIAQEAVARSRAIDEALAPSGAGVVPPAPVEGVMRTGTYVPQASTPGAEKGDIAPAAGLEKAVAADSRWNPLATPWTLLASSPYRALQDWAHQMMGDYSLVTRRNNAGEATPVSAHLRSGRWLAQAAHAERMFQNAYAKYLGKPASASLAGLNFATTAARVGSVARKLRKVGRADGKMEYHEFLEAVFDAHKKDGIEVDLSRFGDQSPEAEELVKDGVTITRGYFDAAEKEGVGAGYLREAPAAFRKRQFDMLDSLETRIGQLSGKVSRTPNEDAQLTLLSQALQLKRGALPERWLDERAYERLRREWDEGIAAGASRAELADLHDRLWSYEQRGIGLRRIGSAPPKAEGVPTGYEAPAAANAPPVAANDGPEPEMGFEWPVFHVGVDTPTPGKAANDANGPKEFKIEVEDAASTRMRAPEETDAQMAARVRAEVEASFPPFREEDLPPAQIAAMMDRWGDSGKTDEQLVADFRALPEGARAARIEGLRREMIRDEVQDRIDAEGFELAEARADAGLYNFPVTREGEVVAIVKVKWEPEERLVYVDWVGQPGKDTNPANANTFGNRFTLDVGMELKRLFPDAERIAGYRVSGARRQSNSTGYTEVNIPAPKRERVQTWEGMEPQSPDWMAAPANRNVDGEGRPLEGVGEPPPPVSARMGDGMLPGFERAANDLGAEAPKTDAHYLTRRWDHEAISDNPDGLRAAFDRWHHDQGKPPMDDGQWKRVLETLMQDQGVPGQPRFGQGPTGGIFRLKRGFDIPNEYVRDYVERNVGSLIREYGARFGAGLEVHRMFGGRDAEDSMTEALVAAAGESRAGNADAILKEMADFRAKMEYGRDQVLGDLHVQDPLTMSKVAAQTIRGYTSTIMLGRVVFSQLVELARPLMTHGFVRNFGFMTDNVIGNLKGYKEASDELRLLVGEGVDTALSIVGQRYMEMGDLNRPGSSLAHRTRARLEPFLAFANGPWYILNGMGPMTDITKNYVMTMSSHFLIEDMARLVAGRASAKTERNLLALGIDRASAERMMAEPHFKDGRLHRANLTEWQDKELAWRFAAAVRGDTNRVISTASPQSRSAVSQGFLDYGTGRRQYAMLTLPFQFMHWGLSATQKITMSALQGRDANVFGGLAALTATAYFANWLKTDQRVWDKIDTEERVLKALDNAGIAAAFFTLNNMVENGSMGMAGVRPALGMPVPFGSESTVEAGMGLGGPFASHMGDIYRAFTDPDATDWETASVVRRSIPGNNLFYTVDGAKALQGYALDGLEAAGF